MQTFFKNQYNFKNKTSPLSRYTIKEKTVEDNFSLMIRLRDIIVVNSPIEAYSICITCGNIGHWRLDMDAGHCFTRDKPMTKYHPKNCHAQCHSCNRFNKGEQAEHILKLEQMYGKTEVFKLRALSKIRGQKKQSDIQLWQMNEEFKMEIKRLSSIKNVKIK